MPTPSSRTSLPRTSSAATTKNAADEKSPGTVIAPSSRRSAGSTVTAPRGQLAVDGHRGARVLGLDRRPRRRAACARCGRGSGARSMTLRRPVGERGRRAAGTTSPGRWRPAAGSRSRAARAPADAQRRQALRRAPRSSAPISRSGSATRSTGRRRIDSSPSSVQLARGWPASQPGSSRSRRAGVADVDRAPPRGAAQADAARSRSLAAARAVDLGADAPRPRRASSAVSAASR